MAEIPGRLRQLVDDGYRIVFFSNQVSILLFQAVAEKTAKTLGGHFILPHFVEHMIQVMQYMH